MKTIAIVTPVYNFGEFVDECIDSVAALVHGRYRIKHVVVDDGSSDGSWEVIQGRIMEDLEAYRLEKNMGGSFARNYGVEKSNADLIFCLDADDVIFQNSIVHLADFLTREKFDWVFGDFVRTDEEMRYRIGDDYYGYDFSTPEEVLTSMFSGEHFFQQNCLYTKKLFDSVGGFDENLQHFQDFNLFTRFLLSGYMPHYLSGALYLHRNHGKNKSKLNKRDSDPELHRDDVRGLYSRFKNEIEDRLSADQIRKIRGYIS